MRDFCQFVFTAESKYDRGLFLRAHSNSASTEVDAFSEVLDAYSAMLDAFSAVLEIWSHFSRVMGRSWGTDRYHAKRESFRLKSSLFNRKEKLQTKTSKNVSVQQI